MYFEMTLLLFEILLFYSQYILMIHQLCIFDYMPTLIAFEVQIDRKSTRLNSSHVSESRMPSSAWSTRLNSSHVSEPRMPSSA